MFLCGHLTQSIVQFGRRLIKHIVKPILTGAIIEKKSQSISKEPELHITKLNHNNHDVAEVSKCICVVMDYLENCGFNALLTTNTSIEDAESSVTLMSELGSAIGVEVLNLIISECLADTIPSTHVQLRSYNKTANVVEKLQKDLIKYKFLHANDRHMTDYVGTVDTLFVDKQCQNILISAETLMKSDMHNMVMVFMNKPTQLLPPLVSGYPKHGNSSTTSESLSADTFHFPSCCVRRVDIELFVYALI